MLRAVRVSYLQGGVYPAAQGIINISLTEKRVIDASVYQVSSAAEGAQDPHLSQSCFRRQDTLQSEDSCGVLLFINSRPLVFQWYEVVTSRHLSVRCILRGKVWLKSEVKFVWCVFGAEVINKNRALKPRNVCPKSATDTIFQLKVVLSVDNSKRKSGSREACRTHWLQK
eukprot:6470957-Amphidinium_carterae.1